VNAREPNGSPEVPDHALIRPIGRGGFGQVWLAANRATGHLRAVKLIPLAHPGARTPASRELTSIARLEENLRARHPNLLAIHHVGKTADYLFYVMDAADDESGEPASTDPAYRPATLESRLRNGPLPPAECLGYAEQLLAGLAALHEAGMVHRDVKPANCLFLDGKLKLADFGLVTAAGPHVSQLGTRKYMPPDGRMDARADVYAAGLVIYQMITGLPVEAFPRVGEATSQVAGQAELAALNRLVLHACEPDPGERFSDARRMADALKTAQRRVWGGRPRARGALGVAAALAVAAVALTTPMPWRERPRPALPEAPPPRTVQVNFITRPFKAAIYLDGERQETAAGRPWLTPCTVRDLAPRARHVVFKRKGLPDLDVGEVDFREHREIEAHWPPAR
jgi:hypothetical protein